MPVIFATGGFEGEIVLNGQPTDVDCPHTAMNCGIGNGSPGIYADPRIYGDENIN